MRVVSVWYGLVENSAAVCNAMPRESPVCNAMFPPTPHLDLKDCAPSVVGRLHVRERSVRQDALHARRARPWPAPWVLVLALFLVHPSVLVLVLFLLHPVTL